MGTDLPISCSTVSHPIWPSREFSALERITMIGGGEVKVPD
jgi:hypothetical protein